MAKVLIVGKNSFISQYLSRHSNFFSVSYKDYKNVDLKDYDVVLNCALNPLSITSYYDVNNDVDFEIAKWANDNKCHYIMFSTRKVYGSSTELKEYYEDSKLKPYDYYSENKVISELKIQSYFGDSSTIIRGSNWYGRELGRNSFMGYFLNSLDKNGGIVYTVSSDTQKDLLYVMDAADAIASMCYKKETGIFNLGSGYGTKIGDVGNWLITGYGQANVKSESNELGEQFILNSDLIYNVLDIQRPQVLNKDIIKNIGSYYARLDHKRSIGV